MIPEGVGDQPQFRLQLTGNHSSRRLIPVQDHRPFGVVHDDVSIHDYGTR